MAETISAAETVSISLRVNGQTYDATVEPRTLLVHFLRENLGLTGTHVGCDTSQCGACTVEVNGESVKSCTMFAVQADGADIVTVEGLANGDQLHPLQTGFWEKHGLQCGYCTPGQIMSALGLIEEGQAGSDPARIREGMSGNLCRCGAYAGITDAVLEVQQNLAADKERRVA
jgi:xanthine dehydrogenase YagT iron-sulfur-binding subunit